MRVDQLRTASSAEGGISILSFQHGDPLCRRGNRNRLLLDQRNQLGTGGRRYTITSIVRLNSRPSGNVVLGHPRTQT